MNLIRKLSLLSSKLGVGREQEPQRSQWNLPTEGKEAELLAACGVRPKLLEFVEELAKHDESFVAFPAPSAKEAAAFKELSPLQEQHAALVLRHCQPLRDMRYRLTPTKMSEDRFWRNYFILVRGHLVWGDDDDGGESAAEKVDDEEPFVLRDNAVDVFAACRATAHESDLDEAQAWTVWTKHVPPPCDEMRNETYF
jgi:hypothetical protein